MTGENPRWHLPNVDPIFTPLTEHSYSKPHWVVTPSCLASTLSPLSSWHTCFPHLDILSIHPFRLNFPTEFSSMINFSCHFYYNCYMFLIIDTIELFLMFCISAMPINPFSEKKNHADLLKRKLSDVMQPDVFILTWLRNCMKVFLGTNQTHVGTASHFQLWRKPRYLTSVKHCHNTSLHN